VIKNTGSSHNYSKPAWLTWCNDSLRARLSGDRIPVDERSKATVYGRSLTAVAGSNPPGSMYVCVVSVVQ
jgi:hypothetical protein